MSYTCNIPALSNILKQISRAALMLWEKGWAESNAGNISVNISEQIVISEIELRTDNPEPLVRACPELANQTFLITGTGKRMRDIPGNPSESLCFIHISEDADKYYLIADESFCSAPSSELHAHLLIHNTIAIHWPGQKVIFHTHPNELIALTHRPDLITQQDFSRLIMSMHPETTIFIPEGIGFVPYLGTGTEELAEESAKEFEKHRVVIWDKHGCLAAGKDLFDAFDLIDLANKAAQIYFMCRKGGYEPEGLSGDQIDDLKKRFKQITK